MKKIILFGKSGAGKTTLIQALEKRELKYSKTQTVEYYSDFIDTPGEYLQNRVRYNALISMSFDADVIGLVQDATTNETYFPGGFGDMFNKLVIGIVTKSDCDEADIERAKYHLNDAGVSQIFITDSFQNKGISGISDLLEDEDEENEKSENG